MLAIVSFLLVATASAQTKPAAKAPAAKPAAVSQQKIPAPEKVTTVEGITEYKLHNGLRVLLFPDASKQTFTVNVTYLVGSKHENYGETGMAHLLEHLVFKGTPKYPYNIMKELEDRGADFNGTTSSDRTNYFETLSATDENFAWAIEMEADRMVNSFIAKKDLESEMTVVRNEFESGENSPIRVLWQRIMANAYEWHNYGKSTIGARSDIENVPIERLQAFYRMYYQPDNAVLVIAGKFETQKALELVNKHFGAIPKPNRALPVFYTRDPVQDGERLITVRRVGDVQWVGVGHKIPSGVHPDNSAVTLIAEILGNEPSGRMYKNLVETKKAAATFMLPMQLKEPGMLISFAQVNKDKSIEEVKDGMIVTYEEFLAKPITEEELGRARTAILKQIELNLNNPDRIGVAMSEYIAKGDWRLFFLERDRLEKTTLDDVNRVANTYFKQSNRTVGLFIPTEKPDRAEIPAEPDVAALVANYKGRGAVASGEAFDPSPSNIESRTQRVALTNGAQIAYLPKKTRGESVQVRMNFRFGNENDLQNKALIGQFTGQMLNRGTATMSRQEIKDAFDKMKARVGIGGGATSAFVSIETTKPNLPEVLKLVEDILKNASFPESEFELLREESIAGIEESRSEPQSVASERLQQHTSPYPKGHPSYAYTLDENIAEIKKLKIGDLKQFHKDFYGVTNGTTIAVVGDFDQEATDAQIKKMLDGWNSKAKYARMPAQMKSVTPINEKLETPDKANAFFLAQYNWAFKDTDPDYPALLLGNYILGEGTNSRLFSRVRGKEGLSYGVGSYFNAGVLDEVATFGAYAIYAPENVAKLEATIKEELNKAVTEGFTAEEIEAAKKGWMQNRTVGRAQDAAVAGTLGNYMFIKRDYKWDEALERKVNALTPEQVNAAMKKHIHPDKINMVMAGDFSKGK
jgi:zinc protease